MPPGWKHIVNWKLRRQSSNDRFPKAVKSSDARNVFSHLRCVCQIADLENSAKPVRLRFLYHGCECLDEATSHTQEYYSVPSEILIK